MSKFNKHNDIDELLRQIMLEEDAKELTDEAWQAIEENVLENEPALMPSPEKEAQLIEKLSNSNNQSGLSTSSKFTIGIVALLGIGLSLWLALATNSTVSLQHTSTRGFETILKLETSNTNPYKFITSTESTIISDKLAPIFKHTSRGIKSQLNLPQTSQKLYSTLNTNKYELLLAKQNQYYATDRVHVHTDKNYFKAGDELNWALYLRNAANLNQSAVSDIAYIELIDPKGKILIRKRIYSPDGSASGLILLPQKLATGKYKIKAYTNWQIKNPDNYLFEKHVYVSSNDQPKLNISVKYSQVAFSAGEKVNAEIHVASPNGNQLSSSKIRYALIIDNIKMLEEEVSINKMSKANIKFNLPEDLKTQNGMLNIAIPYQNAIESFFEPLPIKYKQLQFTMHPESGKLVYDIPNRVVFSVNNEFGNPINIEGYLKNTEGNHITTFKSYYNGVGEFGFLPERGENYTVVITKPIPSTFEYPISNIHDRGQIINAYHIGNDSLQIAIRSSQPLLADLNIKMRSGLVYTKQVNLKNNLKLNLPVNHLPSGIATISLVDENRNTLAERMIYLNIHKKTELVSSIVKQNGKHYLNIKDETNLYSTVSVALISGKPHPQLENNIGTHSSLLLLPELENKVVNPGYYFSKHKKAFKTLDLLLMSNNNLPPNWKKLAEGRMVSAKPERAVLSGRIYNYNGEMLLPGVEIEILETNQKIKSVTGKFTFHPVDITSPKTLIINYKGITKTVLVEDQFNNLIIKLPEIGFDYVNAPKLVGVIGKIINERNKQVISNVEVLANGKKYVSDVNGLFFIPTNKKNINITLVADGYKEIDFMLEVNNNNIIEIQLSENLNTFNLETVQLQNEEKPIKAESVTIEPVLRESFNYEKMKNELLKPTWEFEIMDQLEWVRDAFTNKKYKDEFGNLNVNEHYNVREHNNAVSEHNNAFTQKNNNKNILSKSKMVMSPVFDDSNNNNELLIKATYNNQENFYDKIIYWNSELKLNKLDETMIILPLLNKKTTLTLVIEGISSNGNTIRHIKTISIDNQGVVTKTK